MRTTHLAAVLIAAAGTAGALSAPAAADTVVNVSPAGGRSSAYVGVTGDEAGNKILVDVASDRETFTLLDTVSPVREEYPADGHCRQLDPHLLECWLPSHARINVDANSGDDEVKSTRTATHPMDFRGGSGDDLLTGGTGDDWLFGGKGSDVERGGRGRDELDEFRDWGKDVLLGGPDDDKINSGRRGERRVNCGDGTDVLRLHGARSFPRAKCETTN